MMNKRQREVETTNKNEETTNDDDENVTITLKRRKLSKLDKEDYNIIQKRYYIHSVYEDGEPYCYEINTQHILFDKVIKAFMTKTMDSDYEVSFFNLVTSVSDTSPYQIEMVEQEKFSEFFDIKKFDINEFTGFIIKHDDSESTIDDSDNNHILIQQSNGTLHPMNVGRRRLFLENGILVLHSYT